MDTAARNLRGFVEDVQSPSAGLLDFPSPASDLEIFTPGAASASLAANVTSNPWAGSDVHLPSTTSAIPDTVELQPSIVSPAHELTQPGLDFDTIVGARVAPTPTTPPPPSSLKAGSELRLPSFAQLGIGAPHSEREPVRRPSLARNSIHLGDGLPPSLPQAGAIDFESVTTLPADHRADHVHEHVDTSQPESLPHAQSRVPLHSPLHHYVTTLTPPDDNGRITWESITKIATGPMNTPVAELGTLPADSEVSTAADAAGVPDINIEASTPMEETPRPWLTDAIKVMRKQWNDMRA